MSDPPGSPPIGIPWLSLPCMSISAWSPICLPSNLRFRQCCRSRSFEFKDLRPSKAASANETQGLKRWIKLAHIDCEEIVTVSSVP